jgi:hypothetical protein
MYFGGESGNCPYCGTFVTFQQQHGANVKDSRGSKSVASVTSALCPHCEQAVVFLIKLEPTLTWQRFPLVNPPPILGVPTNVLLAFREACISAEARAPHAAAVMLRRTVASACTDREIPYEMDGRFIQLNKRIARLKANLLPVTYNAALSTKLLGDAGAHEEAEERLGPIDDEIILKAIVVVRQILANLYELPAQLKELDRS